MRCPLHEERPCAARHRVRVNNNGVVGTNGNKRCTIAEFGNQRWHDVCVGRRLNDDDAAVGKEGSLRILRTYLRTRQIEDRVTRSLGLTLDEADVAQGSTAERLQSGDKPGCLDFSDGRVCLGIQNWHVVEFATAG